MKAFRLTVAALFVSLVSFSAAHAQVPYEQGAVERVTLVHILPGHSDAFFADLKANIVPLWESQKAAGLIAGYQIFLNQTTSAPEDWDIGFSITYKSMAALDGLPDKTYELRMKHYGDKGAEQKVVNKRVEDVKVVSSSLIRDITLR